MRYNKKDNIFYPEKFRKKTLSDYFIWLWIRMVVGFPLIYLLFAIVYIVIDLKKGLWK